MSKGLKANYKKAVVSLLIAIFSLNGIAPINPLRAETISNLPVSNEAGSVKIKDTTLTFNGFADAPKGSIGFIANITLERESGIPANTNSIFLGGGGTVTINNVPYEITFGGSHKFDKVSNTKAEMQVSVTATAGQGNKKQLAKNITPEILKGKSMSLKMSGISYYSKNTTVSEQLKEQLKKVSMVQGTSLDKAGLAMLKGSIKEKLVLPAKGLNIPIAEGSQSVVDNIGFVNGKLQIRTKDMNEEISEVHLIDSNGKAVSDKGGGVNDIFNYIFDIKDTAALEKYTVKVTIDKEIASDRESKMITCVF